MSNREISAAKAHNRRSGRGSASPLHGSAHLAKSDPESGGVHHSLSCSDIDRVEDNKVIVDCTADEAKNRWRDENRSRALFEREDQGEMGPRILDRSFEGTYR